jgi:hypothetical protein
VKTHCNLAQWQANMIASLDSQRWIAKALILGKGRYQD